MNRSIIASFLALVLVACAFVGTAQAADPTINKIGPDTIAVGDPDFTLRVNGENFDSGSTVLLDGAAIQTTFITKQRLYARVPVTASAAVGSHTIAVRTAGGVTSPSKALSVVAKSPSVTLIRINSDSIPVLTVAINVEFRLAGSGFNENSKVFVFGQQLDSTVREKNVLSVVVPSGLLMDAAVVPFQVKNGSELSNMVTVPVYGRVASISTIDPGVVDVGSTGVVLKIDGNGFDSDA